MIELVWLAAGGFLGAIARYAIQSSISARWPTKLPCGTLLVNLLGSFLLGLLTGSDLQGQVYLFLGVGFMGAFTTFSTLKLEGVNLFRQGERGTGILYLGLTYLLGFLAAWLGFSFFDDMSFL